MIFPEAGIFASSLAGSHDPGSYVAWLLPDWLPGWAGYQISTGRMPPVIESCAVLTPTVHGPGAVRSSEGLRSLVAPQPLMSVDDDEPLDDPEALDPEALPALEEPLAAPEPPLPEVEPVIDPVPLDVPALPAEDDPPEVPFTLPEPPPPALPEPPPLVLSSPPLAAALPLDAPPVVPAWGVDEQPTISAPAKRAIRVHVMTILAAPPATRRASKPIGLSARMRNRKKRTERGDVGRRADRISHLPEASLYDQEPFLEPSP